MQFPIQPRGYESDRIAYSPTDRSVICLETCCCLFAAVCPLDQSNDSEKPLSQLKIELKSLTLRLNWCRFLLAVRSSDVQSVSNFLKSVYGSSSPKKSDCRHREWKSKENPLQNTGSSKQVGPESPFQRVGKYLQTSGDAPEANLRMQTASQTTHRKHWEIQKFSNKSTTQKKKNNYLCISTLCLRRKDSSQDRTRRAPSDANASCTRKLIIALVC